MPTSTICLDGQIIELTRPRVMGILNVTPDSFYENSRFSQPGEIEKRVIQIVEEGGHFIDIGAYSSRPGAVDIPVEEEIDRLLPALAIIRSLYPGFPVSVDTFRYEVVRRVFDTHGPVIVNDISGGLLDTDMAATVASRKLPYICMHMRGTPQTMQQDTKYGDVVIEVIDFLAQRVAQLHESGVNDIIVDPGFGFGKSTEQNFELLRRLDSFKILKTPVLAGLSRKSMVWKTLQTTPVNALNGTTVVHTIALQKGAKILRTHDVKEAVETVTLFEAVNGDNSSTGDFS